MSESKINKIKSFYRKTIKYLLELVLIILLLIFVAFAQRTKKEDVYKDIIINIFPKNDCKFLEKSDIIKIIQSEYGRVINLKIEEVDINGLESRIKANSFVKNAEVYTDLKGNMYIEVRHRTPILRIKTSNDIQYYLDEYGTKIPLSGNYTARVIIANGYITDKESQNEQLFTLAKYIRKDAFLTSLIGQIYIKKDGEIILLPKIGNFKIEFGDTNNMKSKFKKLKILYYQILPYEGWNKYSHVNLEFKNQIVLNKK